MGTNLHFPRTDQAVASLIMVVRLPAIAIRDRVEELFSIVERNVVIVWVGVNAFILLGSVA